MAHDVRSRTRALLEEMGFDLMFQCRSDGVRKREGEGVIKWERKRKRGRQRP